MRIKKINDKHLTNNAYYILRLAKRRWPTQLRWLPEKDAISSIKLAILENLFSNNKQILTACYSELWKLRKGLLNPLGIKEIEECSPYTQEEVDYASSIMAYYKNHTWEEVCHFFNLEKENINAQRVLSKVSPKHQPGDAGKPRGKRIKIDVKCIPDKKLKDLGFSRTSIWRSKKTGFISLTEEQYKKIKNQL